MSIECWTVPHYKYVLALFLPAFLIYILGVPILFAVLLVKWQASPHRLLLISLTDGYKERCYFWEALTLTRKLLLLLFLTLLAHPFPLLQNLVSMTLLYLSLDWHLRTSPSHEDFYNQSETCSLAIQMVIVACSFYLQAELSLNSHIQTAISLSLFALLILLSACYIVMIVGRSLREKRRKGAIQPLSQEDCIHYQLPPPPPSMVSFEESQIIGESLNPPAELSMVMWPLEPKA